MGASAKPSNSSGVRFSGLFINFFIFIIFTSPNFILLTASVFHSLPYAVHFRYLLFPLPSTSVTFYFRYMLATGESMELAWKAFLTKGKPAKLQMACVIASQQGVAHMAELFPGDDVTLWCAAIDPVLDEHKYIVPGLGDAGDLSFGEKL